MFSENNRKLEQIDTSIFLKGCKKKLLSTLNDSKTYDEFGRKYSIIENVYIKRSIWVATLVESFAQVK